MHPTAQRARTLPWGMLCVGAFVLMATVGHAATGIDAQGQVWQWAVKGEPKMVTGLPSVQRLANGQGYHLALDKQGRIWAWGNNDAGQLGLNHFKRVDQPTQLMLPRQMTAIAAGTRHALAVDDQGQVWSWGSNSQGQLGEGLASAFDLVRQPKRIHTGFTAANVVAGNEFSAAIDLDGNLWFWGLTPPGKMSQPQRIALPARAKTIAASGPQLATTDTAGSIWLWRPPAKPEKVKQAPEWLANATRGDALPVLAKPASEPAPAIAEKRPDPAKPVTPSVRAPTETDRPVPAKSSETKKTTFKLVGRIRSGGKELSGVHIRGTGISCSDSDESGRYTCQANAGWSGSLTPYKPGYRFSPSSVTVPTVQEDDPDVQTFRAIYEPQQ